MGDSAANLTTSLRVGQAADQFQAALAGGQLGPKALKALADELEELSQSERQDVGRPAEQIAARGAGPPGASPSCIPCSLCCAWPCPRAPGRPCPTVA